MWKSDTLVGLRTYDQGQRRPEVSESEKSEPMGLTRAVSVGQVNGRVEVRQ